jgi:hypothetical protein
MLWNMQKLLPNSGAVLSLAMMDVGSGAAHDSPPCATFCFLPPRPPPLPPAAPLAFELSAGSSAESELISCIKRRPACASERISNCGGREKVCREYGKCRRL